MSGKNFIKKDDRDLFNYHDEKIPFLSFKTLDELNIVRNAFTLRNTSEGEAVKLFMTKDDTVENVTFFNELITKELGTDISHRVQACQKHTANVHVVTEEDLGTAISGSHIAFTDGMVTNIKGTVLVISVADCIPLMFVDPVNEAIGIAHSGRKGTLERIGYETVRKMQENFGSEPEDIIATIGPGICEGCYEVGDEIYEEFCGSWGTLVTDRLMKRRGEKYHLDLLAANKLVLMSSGIKNENICISNICNRCNCDKMYSYRADGRIINQIAAYLLLI